MKAARPLEPEARRMLFDAHAADEPDVAGWARFATALRDKLEEERSVLEPTLPRGPLRAKPSPWARYLGTSVAAAAAAWALCSLPAAEFFPALPVAVSSAAAIGPLDVCVGEAVPGAGAAVGAGVAEAAAVASVAPVATVPGHRARVKVSPVLVRGHGIEPDRVRPSRLEVAIRNEAGRSQSPGLGAAARRELSAGAAPEPSAPFRSCSAVEPFPAPLPFDRAIAMRTLASRASAGDTGTTPENGPIDNRYRAMANRAAGMRGVRGERSEQVEQGRYP